MEKFAISQQMYISNLCKGRQPVVSQGFSIMNGAALVPRWLWAAVVTRIVILLGRCASGKSIILKANNSFIDIKV